MSCAVTLMRFPARRTLPSRTLRTPSVWAMPRMSCSLPRNAKDDVRAMTLSAGIFESRFRISSARPSLKYSCSLSPLRLAKGRTAMDGVSAPRAGWFSKREPACSRAARSPTSSEIARRGSCADSEGRFPIVWRGRRMRGLVAHNGRHEFHGRSAVKRALPAQEFVKDQAEREDIGTGIRWLACRLLGRHIARGPITVPGMVAAMVSASLASGSLIRRGRNRAI